MTALALRDDQEYWEDSQLAVLRANGIEEGVTRAELQVYLHECQRRRLDPFTRQIYLIGRWDARQKRKVYRSQTGIDGFRVIARRAADEAKETIEYEDTLWCGPDGEWTDVWLASEPPAACKVVVLRDGKRFPATAKYASYVQVNDKGDAVGLWKKMADNQLAKCTEALALRKAFPEDLGGIYTEEEMAQADNPQVIQATAEVISDEPAQDAPADDPWYVRQSPEQEWLAAALDAAPDRDLDGCKADWQTSVKHVNDGKLTREEAFRLQAILRPRIEDLKAAEQAAEPACETDDSDVIEGMVVGNYGLDEGDDWADKVADITSPEHADPVITEATDLLNSEDMTPEHYARISAAVELRLAEIAQNGELAA